MKIVFDEPKDIIAIAAAVGFMLETIHDSHVASNTYYTLHAQLHNVEEKLATIPELNELLLEFKYAKEKSHTSVQTG